MYRLVIYQTTGTDTVETVLHTPSDVTIERWSKRINAPGALVFSMHKFSPKATDTILRKQRRIRLYRQRRDGSGIFDAVWFGYIEAMRETGIRVEVICAGMLQLFTKRYSGDGESFTGQGSAEAFGLLSDANTTGATGITEGTGGVTSTKDLTIDKKDSLRAWEDLARAHGAEFEIDDAGAFNFVSVLGTDKSAAVRLIFKRDGTPGSNVDDAQIGEDAKPMANRIIGSSSNGSLTSTQNDAASQTIYGVLVERKQFNGANDQGTLDSMTAAYLSQRAYPISDFRLVPSVATKKFDPSSGTRKMTGLQYGDVSVGDLVTVTIVTENRSTSTAKRIAEIVVVVDENLHEQMQFTLSESGVFLTAAYLEVSEAQELRRRIRELEALV